MPTLIIIDLDATPTLASLLSTIKDKIEGDENFIYIISTKTEFDIVQYNTCLQFSNFISSSDLSKKITAIVFRGILGVNLVPLIFNEKHTILFTESTHINFLKKENLFWLFEYLSLSLNKDRYDAFSNAFKFTSSERLLTLYPDNLKALGIEIENY